MDESGMITQNAPDPSRVSYYMTDTLYAELIGDFTDWQRDDLAVTDCGIRDFYRQYLEREARLLDQLRYEEWLRLLAPECVYWVPATPNGGDPRREVAVMFDDRRRLEDRIYRLRTGYAWSQAPSSRTSRLVANVEVFRGNREDIRMVRSNFVISEFWDDQTRRLAGWTGYRFAHHHAGWLISAKQVNLLDCDQCLRNPSIVL